MAHSTFDEVDTNVLFMGSTTQLNDGSAYIKASITQSDLLIDGRLTEYNLTSSGSADSLINQASCYFAAAKYSKNFNVQRAKENETTIPKWKRWHDQGSAFLWQFILNNAQGVLDHQNDYGPPRAWYSTTGGNPTGYDDTQWS